MAKKEDDIIFAVVTEAGCFGELSEITGFDVEAQMVEVEEDEEL